jgi:hypothetical protein
MIQETLQGLAFFGILLFIHVLVWRLGKVRKQMLWLFLIFVGLPLFAFAAFPDQALAIFLTLCFSTAYVQMYPAAQAQSPSLVFLLFIHAHPGRARDELMKTFVSSRLLDDRIADLHRDGLITGETGQLRLRPFGRLLVKFYARFRTLMKLKRGQG